MRYTEFGRTGLNVSRLSMGCNRLGDPGVDPAEWPPVVSRALDLGVTFFDTANGYNDGRSESVLGDVFSTTSTPTVVATKVSGRADNNFRAPREFSEQEVIRGAQESRARLKRDAIDLFMLHSPHVENLENDSWQPGIEKLKSDGTIRWFGVSTHDHASGIRAIEMGADFLQLEYDMLETSAEDELLPLAQKHNIGVMIRTPLARGLLTGKFKAGQELSAEEQWRRPKGDELQRRLRRVEQLRFLEREGQTMAQAALRWVLLHPAVHCVIPGARTVAQLEANIGAIDGDMLPEEIARVRELQDEWRAESVS